MKLQINSLIDRFRSAITSLDHTHRSQSHVTDIDHSDVLDLLSSDRRRWAIQALAAEPSSERVPLSDLAEQVAARENDCSVEELTSQQRKRVYISLQQQHMTQLDGVFVDYDPDKQVAIPTDAARVWEAYRAFRHRLNE
jgi:hypothetical protein